MLITSVTLHRAPVFACETYARAAVEGMYFVQQRYPFFLYAFVVMPDHCHMLLSVPESGSISRIMHTYKRHVSFACAKGPLWQKRFHCRLIEDTATAVEYIHLNPVRAGLSEHPEDYRWSSASGKWDITYVDGMGCHT